MGRLSSNNSTAEAPVSNNSSGILAGRSDDIDDVNGSGGGGALLWRRRESWRRRDNPNRRLQGDDDNQDGRQEETIQGNRQQQAPTDEISQPTVPVTANDDNGGKVSIQPWIRRAVANPPQREEDEGAAQGAVDEYVSEAMPVSMRELEKEVQERLLGKVQVGVKLQLNSSIEAQVVNTDSVSKRSFLKTRLSRPFRRIMKYRRKEQEETTTDM